MTEAAKPPADDAKHKEAIAAKDKEIDELKSQLADAKKGAKEPEPAADEDLTPTPTQDELDAIKRGDHLTADKAGSYRTRQTKAE